VIPRGTLKGEKKKLVGRGQVKQSAGDSATDNSCSARDRHGFFSLNTFIESVERVLLVLTADGMWDWVMESGV